MLQYKKIFFQTSFRTSHSSSANFSVSLAFVCLFVTTSIRLTFKQITICLLSLRLMKLADLPVTYTLFYYIFVLDYI